MASACEEGIEGKVALKEAINLNDLLRGEEITFSVRNEINLDESEADYEAPEDVFDPEALIQNSNFETLDVSEDCFTMPFEGIKSRMSDVIPNGTVKKRVLRQGIGEVMPDDAVVRVHYDAYFEFNEVPFDSTILRGKVEEFVLGSGPIVGMNFAVASMKNREKAEFWLHPSVAFGKIGCPPRIPPNAEVLLIVEVISWKVGSEAAVARALQSEGRASFDVSRDAFKALMREGIELFNKESYRESKFKLMKAKNIILDCRVKDEAEDSERLKLVFKVCLNLAMVLNKLPGAASAPSAITNCKEALRHEPANGKVHLQWGIALITLGEYAKAREHLLKAKNKLSPTDAALVKAFERLEEKKKAEQEVEGAMWRKVFPSISPNKTEIQTEELPPEAQKIISLLEEFSLNPSKNCPLKLRKLSAY